MQPVYYPLNASIETDYANDFSSGTLLTLFGAGTAAIFTGAYLTTKSVRPGLRNSDFLPLLWFVMCGFIHSLFEGYYVSHVLSVTRESHLFAQLWREYAYSDSRYLTRDSVVWSIEAITAVLWGPLSFLMIALIVKGHPLRHPLQMIISMGQLYGVVVYLGTSIFDSNILDVVVWRPEPFYYWFYLMFMNLIWFFIPIALIYQSSNAYAEAVKALNRLSATQNGNGSVRKRQ